MDILKCLNKIKNIPFYFKEYFLKKIYFYITNVIIEIQFNKLYEKKIVQSEGIEKNSSKKLIISLTSYPKRFNKLHLVIYSLLTQTIKPNKVLLILSKKEIEDENSIPSKVLFLKRFGLEIIFIEDNYRSYNKLIQSLRDFPDYNIITVDDDTIYPEWFLEKMYVQHKEYPKDIICYRAHLIKKIDHRLRPYLEWIDYDLKTHFQGMNLFPTGVGGILYPTGSLNKEVFNSKIFLKICPHADDVWFKAMSLLNKTNCRRVFKNKNRHFAILSHTQETGLYKENIDLGRNDEQINKVFKKYNFHESSILAE
jgi:hypothetical protein